MTELSEHAKSILRAIADGKQVIGNKSGVIYPPEYVLTGLAQGHESDFSIKPETRSINGVTFPAPDGSGSYVLVDMFGQSWSSEMARDLAYAAINDALNGVTK